MLLDCGWIKCGRREVWRLLPVCCSWGSLGTRLSGEDWCRVGGPCLSYWKRMVRFINFSMKVFLPLRVRNIAIPWIAFWLRGICNKKSPRKSPTLIRLGWFFSTNEVHPNLRLLNYVREVVGKPGITKALHRWIIPFLGGSLAPLLSKRTTSLRACPNLEEFTKRPKSK